MNTSTIAVEDLVAVTTSRIDRNLALDGCRYEAFPFDVQLPRIEPGRIVLPAEEPGIRSWSLGREIELPVRYRGLTLGRFVLTLPTATSGVALSPGARAIGRSIAERFAVRLADLMLGDDAGANLARRRRDRAKDA